MITATKRHRPLQVVNLLSDINEDVDYLAKECADLGYQRATGQKHYLRTYKTEGTKSVKVVISDNRERYELIKELYYFNLLNLNPMIVEAKSR